MTTTIVSLWKDHGQANKAPPREVDSLSGNLLQQGHAPDHILLGNWLEQDYIP